MPQHKIMELKTIMRKKSKKKEKSRETDQAVRRMKNLKEELRRPENGANKIVLFKKTIKTYSIL